MQFYFEYVCVVHLILSKQVRRPGSGGPQNHFTIRSLKFMKNNWLLKESSKTQSFPQYDWIPIMKMRYADVKLLTADKCYKYFV